MLSLKESVFFFKKNSLYLIWGEFSEGTMLKKKSAEEEEKWSRPGFLLRTSRDRQVLSLTPACSASCTNSLHTA